MHRLDVDRAKHPHEHFPGHGGGRDWTAGVRRLLGELDGKGDGIFDVARGATRYVERNGHGPSLHGQQDATEPLRRVISCAVELVDLKPLQLELPDVRRQREMCRNERHVLPHEVPGVILRFFLRTLGIV